MSFFDDLTQKARAVAATAGEMAKDAADSAKISAAILAENDTFGAKRKERLDSVSAAVILESFLNWRRQHPGEAAPETVPPQSGQE